MHKRSGILLILVGTVLIVSALSLLLYNRQMDAQAGADAQQVLESMQSIMEGPVREETEEPDPSSTEMPVLYLEGYEYVGYLTIPKLELALPVMAQWDYSRLKLAPCRQFGGAETDDLVIAAHNYRSHFGHLDQLEAGDQVTFTGVDGETYAYEVEKSGILRPDQVEDVQNSGYDLVLYTCTTGGKSRVAVFCDRTDAESDAPDVAEGP